MGSVAKASLLLCIILLAQLFGSAASIQEANAAETYSSLTYDGQISFSFEEVVTSTSQLSGTAQITFTLTLDQSSSLHGAGNIQGSTRAQGTFSGTFTDSSPLSSCASTYQLTATYTTAVSGYTSFQTGMVDLSGGTLSNYVQTDSPTIPSGYPCGWSGESDISSILIDCTFHNSQTPRTNGGCDEFPLQGASQAITKGPSDDFKSISGTAQLILVSSTSGGMSSSTSSISTTTSTTTASSTSTSSASLDNCALPQFGIQLVGVRTTPSVATYVNAISDSDTFFIDGKFFQTATPIIPSQCRYSLSVRVTVTITGADGIPFQYGAPVLSSIGGQPIPEVPTTWVTLAAPTPPNQRPLGLWQAVATAEITLTGIYYGTVEIGPVSSNALPFIVESQNPTGNIQVVLPDGQAAAIETYGSIAGNIQGNLQFTPGTGLPTLTFNVAGASGTSGYMTLVIPKSMVGFGLSPAVIVNGIRFPFGGPNDCPPFASKCTTAMFWQDSTTYYIRINMHFSTNAVEIDFIPPSFSNGQSASLVIGQPDFVSKEYYVCQSCLAAPHGVAFDPSGNLWVTDAASDRVVRFSLPFSNGMNADLVIGHSNFTSVGSSTSQNRLRAPVTIAFDTTGNLWVSDFGNSRVLEFKSPFTSGMSASVVIGQPNFTARLDATPQNSLSFPAGLTFDPSGNLWVADTGNNRVLKFAPPFSDGMQVSLVIGQRDFTSYDYLTTQSGLSGPTSVAFDPWGDLWVADGYNNRTLEFAEPFSNGMAASLVIGQSSFTASADCTASQRSVCAPVGVAFDSWGNLWVTSGQDSRILEFAPPFASGMSASWVIGQPDFTSAAGATSGSRLLLNGIGIDLTNVAFDQSGNLWVGDTENNRVLEFASKSGAAAVVPEFPSIAGVSALMLTWLVVLAIVGILISRGLPRLRHVPMR